MLKFINETILLQFIGTTLEYTESIQLLNALLKHTSLIPHIFHNENFNLDSIVKTIFNNLEAIEFTDYWCGYLPLLKTLFEVFYSKDKIPDFPEIQFPNAIRNIKYEIFDPILDFLSIYAVIPNSYFQQF